MSTQWLRPFLPRLVVSLVALVVLSAGAPAVLAAPPGPAAATPPPNRAGLVVEYAESPTDIYTYCVSFSEPEISGEELLSRAGVEVAVAPEGAVCRIGNVGCPADDCFCQCPFPKCTYWAYYHLQGGQWEYDQIGALFSVIRNGDVDGWSWGPGDFTQGTPPPLLTFEQICPSVQPTPTPPPTATPSPTPQPPAEVPEPATLLLAASGLAALAGVVKRSARQAR